MEKIIECSKNYQQNFQTFELSHFLVSLTTRSDNTLQGVSDRLRGSGKTILRYSSSVSDPVTNSAWTIQHFQRRFSDGEQPASNRSDSHNYLDPFVESWTQSSIELRGLLSQLSHLYYHLNVNISHAFISHFTCPRLLQDGVTVLGMDTFLRMIIIFLIFGKKTYGPLQKKLYSLDCTHRIWMHMGLRLCGWRYTSYLPFNSV